MVGPVVDAIFEHPRLVGIYALDADRRDLEVYADIAQELGARRVVDIGCGTGTFALLLAGRGLEVVGVDPAAGSHTEARGKTGADWCAGSTVTRPPCRRCWPISPR